MIGILLQLTKVPGTTLANGTTLGALSLPSCTTLVVGYAETADARFTLGAPAANGTYGAPVTAGAGPVQIAAGLGVASQNISFGGQSCGTLWIGAYKQPRIATEY